MASSAQHPQAPSPFSLSTLIASLALALLLPLAGEAADPISLPVSTLVVPAGATDAGLVLQIHVEGTGAEKEPTVVDVTPAVVVPSVSVVPMHQGVRTGPTGFTWYFQLTLGKIPAKLAQPRQLLISAAGTSETKPYVLTNQSFVWTVKSPAPTWPVRGGAGLKFPLGTVQGPASRVHIVFCRLDGKSPFDCNRLQLCSDSPGSCKKDIDLTEARQSSLSLRLDASALPPGAYTGSVYLAADERSDPESFPLQLSYTSLYWQLLGLLLIAAGVALGWLVTVYARSRISRDRALLAVADFDAAAKSMEEKLATLPAALAGSVTATTQAIADLRLAFTPTNLDQHNFLPTLFGGLGDSTPYQAFLTATGPHIAMLKVIVDGMLAAIAIPETPTPADPHPHQRVLGALDLLDASIQPPSAPTARPQVQALLASLVPTVAGLVSRVPGAPPSTESLLLDISHVNWMAWIVWLVLTIVVGYLVQVDKPGFGTPIDLITCLLWGFGIPAAGMQLGQLTPTSIATTLKVPVV
jgi:hypothetical protein